MKSSSRSKSAQPNPEKQRDLPTEASATRLTAAEERFVRLLVRAELQKWEAK